MEDDTNVTHRRHNPQSDPQTRRRKTPIIAAANGHHNPSSSPPRSSPSSSPFTKSPSYVSLKDLIPSTSPISSPPAAAAAAASSILTYSTISDSGEKISIRNRLVKQAASAYLRPTSTSSEGDRRLWWWLLFYGEVLEPVWVNVRRWFDDAVSRVCSWLTDAFWFLLRWLPR